MSNLPHDILQEIFQLVQNNKNTLSSCLYVNRLWCESVIPVLWQNPFAYNMNNYESTLLIRTYINCFDEDEKKYLERNNVKLPVTNKPIFDYNKYLIKMTG